MPPKLFAVYLGDAAGNDEGVGVELGELARQVGTEVDEIKFRRRDGQLTAEDDAVAVDDLEVDPGIEVNATRVAKPQVHQLLVSRLECVADRENDVMQLDVALPHPSTEVNREKFGRHEGRLTPTIAAEAIFFPARRRLLSRKRGGEEIPGKYLSDRPGDRSVPGISAPRRFRDPLRA